MLKPRFGFFALLMLVSAQAQAGFNLFGSIPCLTNGSSDTCTDACSNEPDCTPEGFADDGYGEAGCCDGLFCDGGANGLTGLTGLLHKSDHCFDDFISPMTNPSSSKTLEHSRKLASSL